jgi:hypothetical protein
MFFDANHDCHLGKSDLMILNKIILPGFMHHQQKFDGKY